MTPAEKEKFKKIVKWILWILVIAWSIGIMHSCIKSKTGTSSTTSPLPNIARAYNLYSDDKEADIYGSSRTYVRADLKPEWVLLTSEKPAGIFTTINGNDFKSRIGFNPKTGEGVWSIEYPTKGFIQSGKVQVAPNSYGGYDIVFTYDDGHVPCKGKLAPI